MIDIKRKTERVEHPHSYFDSFCTCHDRTKNDTLQCSCGEEYDIYEWTWDKDHLTKSATISENEREVLFHQTFSSGTAAVRGKLPFQQNRHYYWEIKMLTALYGTDVMVGVGTENVDMNLWPYRFYSLLGRDGESWGYSYRGNVQHMGTIQEYGPRFGKGSIIGVHLDTCGGTIEFYNNRRPLGVAFSGLKGARLYPMVCSTAAQSAMRVTCAFSLAPNLQLLSLLSLRDHSNVSLAHSIGVVPGLRNMLAPRFWWLIRAGDAPHNDDKHALGAGDAAPRRRKRKRQSAESSSGADSDGDDDRRTTDSSYMSNMILAPCQNCGIVRAIASKKAAHFRNSRLCMFCDLMV